MHAKKLLPGCGHICYCFLESTLVVNTYTIQVECAGVAQEKFERWSKLGGIRVFSA